MPEGDTIFRSARALHQALAGQEITFFHTAYAQLARVHDETPITGRTVQRVEARGKWLLIYLSGDLILLSHMRMSGSWHIYHGKQRWRRARARMTIVLGTRLLQAVAFDVPVAQFLNPRAFERHPAVASLGPDLLGKSFSSDEAAQRLRAHPDEEVGSVLLNQCALAGIGNILKSEICFACGIHPFRRVDSLSAEETECLLAAARRLSAAKVAESSGDGIVTHTGAGRATDLRDRGAHGWHRWVYRRKGQPCRRCGTAILMRKQGANARSTYWCPRCQSPPL